MVQRQCSSEQWVLKFRDIIAAYTEDRAPDPFMIWFRHRDAEEYFVDAFERVLAILIDARFDQRTTAEKALENTITVVRHGALKSPLKREEIPLLIARQNMTSEKWTDLFISSLPKLHELAKGIVRQQRWDAEGLLELMINEIKVPYLGVKTSRLAVRWLHELVPNLEIDMATYKIPIDSLVYRVASRLGIIDPDVDKYYGEGSPADQKIQSFAKQVFSDRPQLLDEPLWSTGRKAQNGGHCFPQQPNHNGCLFESICPRRCLEVDPTEMGMISGPKETQSNRRRHITGLEANATMEKRAQFAEFVEKLRQKGITGQKYREMIEQWDREHRENEGYGDYDEEADSS